MKKTIAILSLTALSLAAVSSARAGGVSFRIGGSVGFAPPVCVAPTRVAPVAPYYVSHVPTVTCAPAPVRVVAPCAPPVYYAPPRFVIAPPAFHLSAPFVDVGFGYRHNHNHRRHHHGHSHHHR